MVLPQDYHNAPEVAHDVPLDYHGREKLQDDNENSKKDEPVDDYNKAGPTICGLRRRTFLIIAAVAVVVVIGAVVGGVVGGLKAKNNNSSSSSSSSSPSASPSPAQATGPIKPNQRAIAVSASANTSSQDVQIFYTALKQQDILYRRLIDDKAQPEQTVSGLTIQPDWGTSLAAAALNGSDPVSTQIFYLSTSTTDNTTSVAQALLECDPGKPTCVTKSNYLISNATAQGGTYSQSRLAALRFDVETARVFHQNEKGDVYALNGGHGENAWTTNLIRPSAHLGSGLVSFAASKDDITLMYVGGDGLPHLLVYSDVLGPGTGKSLTRHLTLFYFLCVVAYPQLTNLDTVIDGSPGSQWSPSVSMAGASAPGMSPRRLFYADPSNGTLVSFFQPNESVPVFKSNHDANWGFVQGGLTATAWGFQTLVYYFEGEDLVVSQQNASVWSKVQNV